MTIRAEEIWNSFCGELTQDGTEDMRQALATSIRVVAENIYYDPDVDLLYKIADELEDL